VVRPESVSDADAEELRAARAVLVRGSMEERREAAYRLIQARWDPRRVVEAMRMIERAPSAAWKWKVARVARKYTEAADARVAAMESRVAEAEADAAEARSLLRLALAWGASLAERAPVATASLESRTGGEPWAAAPVVYFVLNEASGLVKIGRCAGNLHIRLKRARTDAGGARLRVLSLVRGGKDDELAWHRRLAKKRVIGEFFRLEPGDIPPTDFDVSGFNRPESERAGRICAICGCQFAAKSRKATLCGAAKCAYQRGRAKRRKAT
jgi:hypothetical protein